MHKVTLKAFDGLFVRCRACSKQSLVASGPKLGRASVVVAFNSRDQKLTSRCSVCSAELEWSPAEARVAPMEQAAAQSTSAASLANHKLHADLREATAAVH